jgi:hypothetical protein
MELRRGRARRGRKIIAIMHNKFSLSNIHFSLAGDFQITIKNTLSPSSSAAKTHSFDALVDVLRRAVAQNDIFTYFDCFRKRFV